MTQTATVNREVIGGNNPPSDPFELVKVEIDDLYLEAKNWLDGEEIKDAATAEGIATLLNMLRDAGKKADEEFAKEKAPHLKAGRAVDDKWRSLRTMVETAKDACGKVLGAWQAKIELAQAAKAEEARRIAEEATRKAEEAARAAQESTDLKVAEEAIAAAEFARKAEIGAQSAENVTPKVKNRVGRAIGLRTYYIPVLVDPVLAIRHYWPIHKEEFSEVLLRLAKESIRAGVRELPGFTITEEKRSV